MREIEEYFVEMTWDCPNSPCNTMRIPGHSMECPTCGYKKQTSKNDELPEDISPANKVTDSKKLAEAAAGPNWKCSYCHGEERNSRGECINCGSDKKDSVKKETLAKSSGKALSDSWGSAASVVTNPPRFPAFDMDEKAKKAGLKPVETGIPGVKAYTGEPVIVSNKILPPRPKTDWKAVAMALGGLFCVIGIVWFFVWLFAPHIHHAKVIQTHWSYHVELSQRQVNSDSDWQNDMHSGAYNTSCEERQHGTHDCNAYRCNPHQVNHPINPHRCNCVTTPRTCDAPVCTRLDNGYSRCRRSCEPAHTECDTCTDDHYVTEYDTCYHQCPTMDQWCSYNYDTWPVVARDDRSGDDHNIVRPPLVAAGPDQRTSDRLSFHVRFQRHDDEFHDYTPSDLDDYNRFQFGTRWRIETSHAGTFRPIQAGQ